MLRSNTWFAMTFAAAAPLAWAATPAAGKEVTLQKIIDGTNETIVGTPVELGRKVTFPVATQRRTYTIDVAGASCQALIASLTAQAASREFIDRPTSIDTLVYTGIIYLSGYRPYASSPNGSASGDGSALIVQRGVKSGQTVVDRYMFLESGTGNPMDVWTSGRPPDEQTVPVGQYADIRLVGNDLVIEGPYDIASSSQATQDCATIVQMAAAAGLPVPPGLHEDEGEPEPALQIDDRSLERLRGLIRDEVRRALRGSGRQQSPPGGGG